MVNSYIILKIRLWRLSSCYRSLVSLYMLLQKPNQAVIVLRRCASLYWGPSTNRVHGHLSPLWIQRMDHCVQSFLYPLSVFIRYGVTGQLFLCLACITQCAVSLLWHWTIKKNHHQWIRQTLITSQSNEGAGLMPHVKEKVCHAENCAVCDRIVQNLSAQWTMNWLM